MTTFAIRADGSSSDAWVQKVLPAIHDEFYLGFKWAVPAAEITFIGAGHFGGEIYRLGQAGELLVADATIEGLYLDRFTLKPFTDYCSAAFNGAFASDTYYQVDVHIKISTGTEEIKINGTPYTPAGTGTHLMSEGPLKYLSMGFIFANNNPAEVYYFKDITLGTTAYGSTDLFQDDNSTADLSLWSSNSGANISVVLDPYGPDKLDDHVISSITTPSGVELGPDTDTIYSRTIVSPAGLFAASDSGTIRSFATSSGLDHICVYNPHFHADASERWSIVDGEARWTEIMSPERFAAIASIDRNNNPC